MRCSGPYWSHWLYLKYLENHLLPDAVVCSLEVGQHLENNLLCIALVTPVLTVKGTQISSPIILEERADKEQPSLSIQETYIAYSKSTARCLTETSRSVFKALIT